MEKFTAGRLSWRGKKERNEGEQLRRKSTVGEQLRQMYSDAWVTGCQDKGRIYPFIYARPRRILASHSSSQEIFHRVDICDEAETARGMDQGECYIFSSSNAAASLHQFVFARISICFLFLGSCGSLTCLPTFMSLKLLCPLSLDSRETAPFLFLEYFYVFSSLQPLLACLMAFFF